MLDRENRQKNGLTKLCRPLCGILSPVCTVIFYGAVILIALLLVLMFIVFLMNTSVDDMLLPPFMHKIIGEGGVTEGYEIFLGNGVKVIRDAASVTAQDIKTVIYAGIILLIGALLITAPTAKFIGLLSRNIRQKNYFDEKNGRYVVYTGLTVLFGNPFILFVSRFYNYYLIKTFLKESADMMRLQLGFDIYGMIFGALILFFGLVYWKTIAVINEERAENNGPKEVVASDSEESEEN